jgi:hypothetical protein
VQAEEEALAPTLVFRGDRRTTPENVRGRLTGARMRPKLQAVSSLKDLKLAQKASQEQRQVVVELKTLVIDIERSEKTIVGLKGELENINSKYQGRRTTREDVAYLTDLLACAKKKLAWEKHIGSLQKRTPQVLEKMSKVIHDPQNPPSEESRAQMLGSLQAVQAAMERLQNVKAD